VRLIEHRAPRDLVNTYAVQMRQGAVSRDRRDHRELVDGNHGSRPQSMPGEAIPAYVCRRDVGVEIVSLSIELNQSTDSG